VTIEQYEIEQDIAKFDLTLSMVETAAGIVAEINYSTALFADTTITRMLGHLQLLLASIVAKPEQRLSEVQMLSDAEQHQLLVEWNDTSSEYPNDKCIHQLFEEQVECTPDAIAVVFENEQLTYQELNRRANQLAHYLRTLDVGPEIIVGICLER